MCVFRCDEKCRQREQGHRRWELIAGADKARSGASPRVGLGRPSGERWGQAPKRRRAPARAGKPGRERGLRGGTGRPPCSPGRWAPPPAGRSWFVKMRALIVTERRRPPVRPLPAAVRAAPQLCARLADLTCDQAAGCRAGGRALGAAAAPCTPPRLGRSCPRLCAPFVPREDRCAALIRRATDGGDDRRFHLLTSNVGAGEGEERARPWPARWLTR